MAGGRAHLDSVAQTLLADAAQADELVAVGGGQQVLRHCHLQLEALQGSSGGGDIAVCVGVERC